MLKLAIKQGNQLILRIVTGAMLLVACHCSLAQDLTTRVSVNSVGDEGDDRSSEPSISADGRYVVFHSSASNLVEGDTNNSNDIFVHDRVTGKTTRVSMDSAGNINPVISADGRYVAYQSNGRISGNQNLWAIFTHDRETGETTRVSVDSTGVPAGPQVWNPDISADGRYVAFSGTANDLVEDDTGIIEDVFVHDRVTGETTRVSVNSAGREADRSSRRPAISASGRYVTFDSEALNLVEDDTNGDGDVFVHDRVTGETTRVSVNSAGGEGTNDGGSPDSRAPSISADGRYVAFHSWASNLVAGDTNGTEDVFVHDRVTGETTRSSVNSGGNESNGTSNTSSISADGRYVAFHSWASNLVEGDTNGAQDIFLHDRVTGETTRVSVNRGGSESNGASNTPAISADGRYVAFESSASNLVEGDTNVEGDVFVRDIEPAISLNDEDKDGIPDTIEMAQGYYHGTEWIPLDESVRKDRPDVLVFVDYLESKGVREKSLDEVKKAFARKGINLVIKISNKGVPDKFLQSLNAPVNLVKNDLDKCKQDWSDLDSIKNGRDDSEFRPGMEYAYHYALIWEQGKIIEAFDQCVDVTQVVGLARGNDATGNEAADFIVSDVYVENIFEAFQMNMSFAANFMHELGHTLGLRHGGMDEENYKPNHLSVMNYLYNTRGLVNRGGFRNPFWPNILDYSSFGDNDLRDLNEEFIDENILLAKSEAVKDYKIRYVSPNRDIYEAPLDDKIDWDDNGRYEQIENINLNQDPNKEGASSSCQLQSTIDPSLSSCGVLRTFNEWKILDFKYGAVGGFGQQFDPPVLTEIQEELTIEEAQSMGPPVSSVVGDYDFDGDADQDDLDYVLTQLNDDPTGTECGYLCDVNGDNVINQLDADLLSGVCTRQDCETNYLPLAEDQSLEIEEDSPVTITLSATDADGDALSYQLLVQPTNGTISGSLPDLTYTPDSNFNGNDSFTFKVNDGIADSAAATVSITVNAANDPPQAVIEISPISGPAPLLVNGNASGSSDVDDNIETYSWDFGDSMFETGVSVQHTYQAAGVYTVSLTVTDSDGETDAVTQQVTVDQAIPNTPKVAVQEAISLVQSLPADQFRKNKKSLMIKLFNRAIADIEKADASGNLKHYQEAIKDLLKARSRTDGCVLRGEPDKQDYILSCDAQPDVYEATTLAIALLE